jgi:hypothetical protein
MVRVDDKYCSLPCEDAERKTCGGNYSYSVYCNADKESCLKYIPRPIEDPYETLSLLAVLEGSDDDELEFESGEESIITKDLELVFGCAFCSSGCLYPNFIPASDYLHGNSPKACAEYCRREIHYWANGSKTRYPAPMAALGWANRSALVPICSCLGPDVIFEVLPDEECAATCPGDNTALCGSPYKYHYSVYLTGAPF